jgi:hypothetical protein
MTGISQHILAASAAMVGVCMTGIGIVQVVTTVRRIDSVADDLLVADALLFLLACILSHASIRNEHRSRWLERWADASFILALGLMIAVCGVLVYAVE